MSGFTLHVRSGLKLILASLALVLAFPAHAGDFKPSSLQEIVGILNKTGTPEPAGKAATYHAVMEGYSALVEYTGEARKISGHRAAFIKDLAKMLQKPDLAAAYQNEIRVKESRSSYWIPVQEAFFSDLSKELKPGQTFTIYVRTAGKTLDNESMILMMDFNSSMLTGSE